MCLIVLALKVHPEYPLIIAANRDEFYLRPTATLAYWDDQTHILAGRDLQGKGTWLGVSRNGRMAAVTNYRDPASDKPGALSRGLLACGFLMEAQSPEAYVHRISDQGNLYNGFNLIVGDLSQYWWVSNLAPAPMKLTPGIHGISNRLLNTPWPKLEKAKAVFFNIITGNEKNLPEKIFNLLADTTAPPDESLPDTGVGLDWERILSPIFVISDGYGTRSSSIIFYHHSGLVTFLERTFKIPSPIPTPENTRKFEIHLKPLNDQFLI
jgi:uncharacterized protein with NRDE domain